MEDYRARFIPEIISSAELEEKWERYKELIHQAMIDSYGERDHLEDWDEEAYLEDITHGEFDFDAFLGGYPESLDAILRNLEEAHESIDTSWSTFSQLDGDLAQWDTRAAEDFQLNYMAKFPEANLNQLAVIEELITLTGAYRELIARTRFDLAAILDSGIEACQNFEPSNGSSSWNSFFTTVGVLAGVAAAVTLALPAGAAASVGAAATIGGAASGVGGALTNDGEQHTRTYEEAGQISYDVMIALRDLRDRATQEAEEILATVEADIATFGPGADLVVNRADVADLAGDELIEQFPYQGGLSTISADLYELWRAGKLRLPLVAVSYAEAAQSVNATRWFRPWAASSFPIVGEGAASKWDSLFDVLQRRLAEVRNDLADTGEILCEIADAYAKADMEGAELVHDQANSLLADLWIQIDESTENGNLDEIPQYIPQAPEPDDVLTPFYQPYR